ncbi:hypothetical protein AAL_06231 [Moelleriella libera RCEF 2490]|uniref:Uncharacterized protein n=1 Tax=Moelleriella libera RCEF 2490 TaxID=1081109 RepID=A0A167Z187_9HYPO|nr:hypothetical protein AAL_06231 [Moelleriella libera RCEF 2490]
MSMMFFEELIVPGRCPRCKTLSSAPEDANAKCPNRDCQLNFKTSNKSFNAHRLALLSGGKGDRSQSFDCELRDFQRVCVVKREEDDGDCSVGDIQASIHDYPRLRSIPEDSILAPHPKLAG